MTPAQRRTRATIAALSMRAQGKTNTVNASAAFLPPFEAQVDPRRELSEDERLRRTGYARSAYFRRLAQRSAAARSRPHS